MYHIPHRGICQSYGLKFSLLTSKPIFSYAKISLKETGLIHIPVVLILLVVVAVGSGLLISQTSNQDVKGTLIAKDRDDDRDENKTETPKPTSTSGSTTTKTTTPEGVRIETKTSDEKQKTEIRFSETEKIKTRVEEGRSKVDIYSGGVKVRYEIRDGRVIIKAETEEGKEVEDEEAIVKIVDRLDKTGIKIATAGGELLVARNQIGALANFPLQIDLNTNQLIASTSAGTKVLTVLPDQAVQNMLAANVISRLSPQAIVEAALTGQATSVSSVVELGIRNNIPVYEIPGIRDFRLLGFIPVSQPVTVVVSAETGQVVSTEQSILTRVVDLLSP